MTEGRLGRLYSTFEAVLVVVALFSFTGAVFPLLYKPEGQNVVGGGQDPISPALHVAAYAFASLRLLAAPALRTEAFRVPASLVALVGLAGLSTLWSFDASRSLRSAVLLAATGTFAMYFATRFPPRKQLVLLAWTLGLVGLASILFVVYAPDYGIGAGIHSGNWRGAFTRKNALGTEMALAAAVFSLLALRGGIMAPLLWLLTAGSLALVVMSSSAGGIVLCLALLLAAALLRTSNARNLPWGLVAIVVAALVVAIGSLVFNYWDVVLGALGKDATLTGRTALWATVALKIAEEPVFGYGLQAFWLGSKGLNVDVWRVVGWTPPHAHSGLFDVTLDLGFVGLGVFLLGFLWEYLRGIRNVRTSRTPIEDAWPVVYLTFFFVSNLTETSILRHTSFTWMLYVIAVATIAQRRRAHDDLLRPVLRLREEPASSGAHLGALSR